MTLTIAQTLFSALQTKEVTEMCSMFCCESQLQKLEDTVFTIKALLLDVDSKRQGLTHEGQVWVEKLKDDVYDVDDLVDEFVTSGQQRKQMRDAKLSKKVGQFSRNNKFLVAFNVSQEIKILTKKLNAIAKNHSEFGFTDVTKPIKRRAETSSNISDLEVIGRDLEMEDIVGMLLSDSHSSERNVSFVSIVGMGGLGKTTLAQLVYSHKRVKEAFSQRVWVCVSKEFDVTKILGKMLGRRMFNLEILQRELRSLLEGKRYLLVLEDVWNESHDEWRKLKSYLVSGASGSKILITSRSKKVATFVGQKDSSMYELKGLTEENSWNLFKRVAFGETEDQLIDPSLMDIGKNIVKKCASVPLSIRVIASLLHDQDKSQWRLFNSSNDLAKISQDGRQENSIMRTLMFSYYQLTPELKSCFSFCSLFPKDFIIAKELLISLWLAGGCLITTNNVQSMEDIGEQYYSILLNRCFFQDIKLDKLGDVRSFKMHDLMHDLAVHVAGKESLMITSATENYWGQKTRHLYIERGSSNMCLNDTLRTYTWLYSYDRDSSLAEETAVISRCRHLRVLSLRRFGVGTTLPNNISRLIHLRYLDLSENSVEMLPKSIAKLHNLPILKLSNCKRLKQLSEDMTKLVNLKTLDLRYCLALTYMPKGMSNLTNLHTLTNFVVGGVDLKQTKRSKLIDLKALRNLKGDLCISIRDFCSHNRPQGTKRAFILKDARLRKLEIRCGNWCCDATELPIFRWHRPHEIYIRLYEGEVHETLVEDLCPNDDDISKINMVGYKSTKMPSWASMTGSNVNEMKQVTSLSQFHNLKVVYLGLLENVEYIEDI